MARSADFARYVAAGDYPGVLDEAVVTASLYEYLRALAITRTVRRLPVHWDLATEEPLRRSVAWILDDMARRHTLLDASDASDARAAIAALDARAAIAALDARAALASNEAIAAREARDARAARDASEGLACSDARAAIAARDARVALDARSARAARVALDARAAHTASDARSARAARVALDARAALAAHTASDARAARAALAALDATGARAIDRFALWCVNRGAWWYSWDLSWINTILIGSQQIETPISWARPVFEAYVAGAWFLLWTDDTLYWVAKPIVHVERGPLGRRLHCETGPAVESDAEDLYFWHGVLVPSFAVLRPDLITLDHIRHEENAEVRRILIARYGWERWLNDQGATPISSDRVGLLYRTEMDGAAIGVVVVANSTPEPDGSRKRYALLVPPDHETAQSAVASTFGLTAAQYQPSMET